MTLKTLRKAVTATGDLLDPTAGKRIVLYDMQISTSAAIRAAIWHGSSQTDDNTLADVFLPANGVANRPFRRRNQEVGHVLPAGEILKIAQTGVGTVTVIIDYAII